MAVGHTLRVILGVADGAEMQQQISVTEGYRSPCLPISSVPVLSEGPEERNAAQNITLVRSCVAGGEADLIIYVIVWYDFSSFRYLIWRRLLV